MEMQFYPPGWVPNALGPAGSSCTPTQWCAALNIDSVSDNPVTGQNNNPACAAAAGIEYVNFAEYHQERRSTRPGQPVAGYQ